MFFSLLHYFRMRRFGFALMLPAALSSAIATTPFQAAMSQPSAASNALKIDADVQEANSQTGVFTARGNVQISYPARQIQATAAQAQYFSRERRIVMSGNVSILQQGNSIRGETVTYLIDEGRFVATPKSNQQVQSVYIVSDQNNPTQPPPPAIPPLNPQPASKNPVSSPATPRR